MSANRHWFRKLARLCWIAIAAVLIFLAAFLGTMQLLLPVAGQYRENVEQWASRSFGQPVRIAGLGAAWRGFGPRLKLEGVQLLDRDGGNELVRFDAAYIGIDLIRSLAFGAVRPGAITIVGIRLTLHRNADGSIAISGLGAREAPSDEEVRMRREAVQRWFLRQSQLAIEAGEIEWLDAQQRHTPWVFRNVRARLRNAGERHQLEAYATLPEALGRRVQIGIDATGNLLNPSEWQGQLYLQGAAVRLHEWLGGRTLLGTRLVEGSADFKLWGEWADGGLRHIDGDVGASYLRLASAAAAPMTAIDAISGRFSWRRHEGGWAIGVESFLLKRRDEIWPPSDFHFAYADHADGPVFEGAAEFLRLEDVSAVMLTSGAISAPLRDALAHLHPAGVVRGLRVHHQRNTGRPDQYRIEADVNALITRPWKGIPGVSAFAGALVTTETTGHVDLNTHAAAVEFDTLFRERLPVGNAIGRVAWSRADGAWRVRSGALTVANDDIAAQGTLDLTLPDDRQSPFLDLVVNYEHGNGAHTARYLPVGIMPPKAVEWLDRAIVSGEVTSGGLIYRGRLKDFPFDDRSGHFEARFNVRDAILDYAPGWPRLEEIEAEVAFENQGMVVSAHEGKSFASTLDEAQVTIKDFRAADREVVITGRAHGPTSDALRYLRESPLYDKFGKHLVDAAATGSSTLDLTLNLPLRPEARPTLKADIGFDDSELRIGDRVAITRINGSLAVTERGLSASGIDAHVLGLPATIDAATDDSVEPPLTRFSARGNAAIDEFATLVELPLVFGRLGGRTDWDADLRLRPRRDGPADVVLDIRSALQGIEVRFPAPLGKDAVTPRALRVVMPLPQTPQRAVRISYGDELRVAYAARETPAGLRPDRMAIGFGRGDIDVPAAPGIRVSGELQRAALPEWENVFAGDRTSAAGETLQVTAVDLGIRELNAFERRFDDVRVTAKRDARVWSADVASKQMSGKIQYPHDAAMPLVMNLDYLKLERLGEKKDGGEPADPRKLPPLRVRAKQFVYGSGDWGALDLVTSRRPDGMHVDTATLESGTTQVNARGDWVVVKGAHSSSLDLKMNTGDLGQVLRNLDYVGGIDGGRGAVELIALWKGPMSAFALEHLDGTMRMKVENGRILEIEPGAGRLFGLLSVQALPRRLSLDFSDLFRKGFGFDTMAGEFSIDGGNAYTDDFYVEGPAARIEFHGRTGLGKRDYDQLVTVTPHVSSGLPVAGVIAGGPAIGAAVYLAERLLKPGIEEIVTIQYAVKGDWANPSVERVTKPSQTETR